jgi:hypothetical protein
MRTRQARSRGAAAPVAAIENGQRRDCPCIGGIGKESHAKAQF